MTNTSDDFCHACGATVAPGAKCWLCESEQPVIAEIAKVNPYQPPAIAGYEESAGMVTGLLLVTVIVVCGVLSLVAPGLGIPLAIAVLPALIRTIVHTQRERNRTGQPLTVGNQVSVFIVSIAGVVAACCAAAVAFFSVCVAACFGMVATDNDDLLGFAFGTGAIAGVSAGIWCLKKLWAKRKHAA